MKAKKKVNEKSLVSTVNLAELAIATLIRLSPDFCFSESMLAPQRRRSYIARCLRAVLSKLLMGTLLCISGAETSDNMLHRSV